ncbi:MAG: hypothetical protein ACRD27_12525 [Terracidiphilus sp.]
MSDAELNKAAVLIVKLLLRTREGRIRWSPCDPALPGGKTFIARMEDQMSAYLSKNDKVFNFALANTKLPSSEEIVGIDLGRYMSERTIISVALAHSWDSEEDVTPESIVYSNLKQLFQLAENPKSVSEDRLYQQAMTYLDKIAV